MFTRQEDLAFKSIQETLSSAAIADLCDIADGGFGYFEYTWIRDALLKRNLITVVNLNEFTLTKTGMRFVLWHRQPRELAVQVELF